MKQKDADEVNSNVKNMMKSGLQGPRPAQLKMCKDSHKIPVTQRRPPVIIYTRSPEVIHTQPQDFSKLVQRLTGSTSSNLHKSHRSRMKAAVVEGRSSHSQVVLESSTSSPDHSHQEFSSEDFFSRERKESMPAEYTNINDPVMTTSDICVSNNPDIAASARDQEYSNNFLQQIMSPFGLHSPEFTLNPSLSTNFFPIRPSPRWILQKSSDISPGYPFPMEYLNPPTDAPFNNIFTLPHVRPPTSNSKDFHSDPFHRFP